MNGCDGALNVVRSALLSGPSKQLHNDAELLVRFVTIPIAGS